MFFYISYLLYLQETVLRILEPISRVLTSLNDFDKGVSVNMWHGMNYILFNIEEDIICLYSSFQPVYKKLHLLSICVHLLCIFMTPVLAGTCVFAGGAVNERAAFLCRRANSLRRIPFTLRSPNSLLLCSPTLMRDKKRTLWPLMLFKRALVFCVLDHLSGTRRREPWPRPYSLPHPSIHGA